MAALKSRRQGLGLPLSLALQGGGAHGAFAAGVLDALLQQAQLSIDGISGSSAGALNAALLAEGWRRGGREGARAALATFWKALGEQLPPGLVRDGDPPTLGLAGRWLFACLGSLSPAQFNPLAINPLRDLLEQQIDFAALRRDCPVRLFIAATQQRSGRLRLFREHELSVDVLLASACLPRLHHPVRIDGELYWDGGYAANPALQPLCWDCEAEDLLLLLLDPLQHEEVPLQVANIDARVAALGFTSHLLRELQWLNQATQLARQSWWPGRLERRLRHLRWHLVDGGALPELQHAASKALPHAGFLQRLQELGQRHGQAWWQRHGEQLGRSSSLSLQRFA